MVKLSEQDIIALKGLAAVVPQLEAILGAPTQPRTDAAYDFDDDDNKRLARRIADGDHFSNLQERIENAWRQK